MRAIEAGCLPGVRCAPSRLRSRLLGLGCAGLLVLQTFAAHAELRPFAEGSYRQLVAEREGQAFLLVFWSLDCAPCHEELSMLGRLAADHPGFAPVLVSVDGAAAAAEAHAFLQARGLGAAPSWVFSGASERLRHAVDPTWYGELPRSYFFDADHVRRGVSGKIPEHDVRLWLRDHLPARSDEQP